MNRMIDMADLVFGSQSTERETVRQYLSPYAFIANETGLFGSWRTNPKTGRALTIPQLANS